jgi:two-component system LytT family response regulator
MTGDAVPPVNAGMAPVRAIIVDDEPIARDGLRDLLRDVSWIECVGEAASGPAAVEALDSLKPDIVFLDIQMPGYSGLEVLQRASHRPFVVFTTAFGQHAVTAFELGAIDYLLKPFGGERLATTLERVRAALGEPAPPAVDRLTEAMSQGPMSRLFVRSGGSIIPVSVDAVTRFEAWGDYVTAFVGRSRHVLHLSLNRLEERLDPAKFARIHRTHLVNLAHVVAFRKQGKGRLVAELDDGARLAVGRSRAKALRGLGA